MALTQEGLYQEIYDNVIASFIDDSGFDDAGKAKLEEQVEKLAKAIVDHIVENIENLLLERFDNLESDFDGFVQAMAGVGAGPATAVPAGVATFLATSKTLTRATQKIQQEAIETPYIHGSK